MERPGSQLEPTLGFRSSSPYERPKSTDREIDYNSHGYAESATFEVTRGAIEEIIKQVNGNITWNVLKKYKLPFATKKIDLLCNRVTEMTFMKPDQRKAEEDLCEVNTEPKPASFDMNAPYQVNVK